MSDAANLVTNKRCYRDTNSGYYYAKRLFIFAATCRNYYVRQGVCVLLYFLYQKCHFLIFAQPSSLKFSEVKFVRVIAAALYLVLVVIMHPGFVRFFGQFSVRMYQEYKHIRIRTIFVK